MGWVDAFYFTVETMTTTGYGDFSFVNQPTWLRTFATVLMFSGVTTTALLVSFVADVLLSRRFVFASSRTRVRHLRNHIVVVGLSALGIRVVSELTAAGYEVAVIERQRGQPVPVGAARPRRTGHLRRRHAAPDTASGTSGSRPRGGGTDP